MAALLGRRPYPDLVKTVPHVAFEVDDLQAALEGQQSDHRTQQSERRRDRRLHRRQRRTGRADADRSRCPPGPVDHLPAGGERCLQLGDGLIDREAGRLLTRRELLERLEELADDAAAAIPGRRCRHPILVRVRRDVGALEGVGAQVEELRDAQRHERLGPDRRVPCARCSMNTAFQLSKRSASTSPSSEK